MTNESMMIEKFMDCWMRDDQEVDGQRTYNVARYGDSLVDEGVELGIVLSVSNIACRLIMEIESIESDGSNA